MNVITDTVENRRAIARYVVPSNVQALRSLGHACESVDGNEYRVAGKVAFFPKNGFWRFLDGSRQGYGASRLIPELTLGAALAAMVPPETTLVIIDTLVDHLQKPATGRDSPHSRPDDSQLGAESVAGPSSSLLPLVTP
jgi:hypothetical protein